MGWTDHRVEVIIGNLLRAGVLLAAAVVLVGGGIFLVRHGSAAPHYAVFRGEPTDLRTPSGVLAEAVRLQGRGIIQLGLLILLATPLARVAFSVFAFTMERDRLYVIVTLIVLAVLAFSLAGGAL
ncbi:MAG: DUF1634 domain-containing protein [Acidobacteriia bacterium]|nr:DUF1634 domain-containing protein [Terriglobia bacterium]